MPNSHGSVWVLSPDSGQIMSLYSEGLAASLAESEKDPGAIYFFAELDSI